MDKIVNSVQEMPNAKCLSEIFVVVLLFNKNTR